MCPQRLRFDGLDEPELDRVIETLAPFVSEERRASIDRVISTRTRALVVVLEDIYDEHNASAVLRSADAFGIQEVHIVERTTKFLVQPKTSIGAHKWLDLRRHKRAAEVYDDLAARGYEVWASSVTADAVPIGALDPAKKLALVFGNEHEGLSAEAVKAAHGRFHVPMVGFVESLNVSVATALSMYDVLARKRAAGTLELLSQVEQKRTRAEWFALSVRGAKPILARAGVSTGVSHPVPIAIVGE